VKGGKRTADRELGGGRKTFERMQGKEKERTKTFISGREPYRKKNMVGTKKASMCKGRGEPVLNSERKGSCRKSGGVALFKQWGPLLAQGECQANPIPTLDQRKEKTKKEEGKKDEG